MQRTNFKYRSASVEQTIACGVHIATAARPGDIICLYGPLGAGKTHLAKGIASYFGIPAEQVDSPTFVLLQEYHGRHPVYHFDAYRLKSLDEARGIGFEEYIYDEGISIVEWPERVAELLPEERTDVYMSQLAGQQRQIEVVYKP